METMTVSVLKSMSVSFIFIFMLSICQPRTPSDIQKKILNMKHVSNVPSTNNT